MLLTELSWLLSGHVWLSDCQLPVFTPRSLGLILIKTCQQQKKTTIFSIKAMVGLF